MGSSRVALIGQAAYSLPFLYKPSGWGPLPDSSSEVPTHQWPMCPVIRVWACYLGWAESSSLSSLPEAHHDGDEHAEVICQTLPQDSVIYLGLSYVRRKSGRCSQSDLRSPLLRPTARSRTR